MMLERRKPIGGLDRITRSAQRYGLVALVVLALAAAATAQPEQERDATPSIWASARTVIVPGQAIGPWSLDMTFTDLIWTLGVRTVLLSPPGPQYRTELEYTAWSNPPVVAIHGYADNRLYALGIADSGYVTREGVGVGASEAQVTTAYGRAPSVVLLPARPKMLLYNEKGVAFQVAFNSASGTYGAVERIFVFWPGQAGAIWRVP